MHELVKRLLVPRNIGHDKIRIGPKHDGGYVVSRQCLENTTAVYSLGIGDDVEFDTEIAERGLPVYQYDGTIEQLPKLHENFHFKSLMMDSQTLTTEIHLNNHASSENLLLKMDIEGYEYELIGNIDWKILDCFNQIVFEMHGCVNLDMVLPLLQKMSQQFVLIHLHSNNNDYRSNNGIPNVLELTWVNNRCFSSTTSCPIIGLDYANFNDRPELLLDWWLPAEQRSSI